MRQLKGRQARDQPAHGEGGERVDPQQPALAALDLARRRERDAVQRRADLRQIGGACLGQHDAPVVTLEQRLVQPRLQRLHLPADRAVGHVKLVGRLGEAGMPRRGLEGTQSIQRRQAAVHSRQLSSRITVRITRLRGPDARGTWCDRTMTVMETADVGHECRAYRSKPDRGPASDARRTLLVAGVAHALHDGYTDLIYVLLPVWQADSAWATACWRCCAASMPAPWRDCRSRPAGWPSGSAAARCWRSAPRSRRSATFWRDFPAACSAFARRSRCRAPARARSTRIASAAVSRAYGAAARGPLGTYNFTGDLGKAAIPAATGLLLTLMPWRPSLWLSGRARASWSRRRSRCCCLRCDRRGRRKPSRPVAGRGHGGFPLLFAIGVLDTGVRMGLLTFLPFLLQGEGRHAAHGRAGPGTGVHRRRRRQVRLRLARRPRRRSLDRAADRGRHGGVHPGGPGAAARSHAGPAAAARA